MAANRGYNPVDDRHQVFLVAKDELSRSKPTVGFEENILRTVDHDLCDGRICQDGFERTITCDVIEDFIDYAAPFPTRNFGTFCLDQLFQLFPDQLVSWIFDIIERCNGQIADPFFGLTQGIRDYRFG